MKDIFEAIECLTAQLSVRLERSAQKKGYPVHYAGYSTQPRPGLFIKVYHTLVHLPRGYSANFQPAETPAEGGKSWHIGIRRGDGIVRASYVEGLSIRENKGAEGGFAVFYGNEPLTAEHIEALFEDLQKPGPSGLQLAITRQWTVRFGAMPLGVAQQIEVLKNVDHMDLIFDALIDQRSRKQIDELIANEPPLHAPPRLLKYLPRD